MEDDLDDRLEARLAELAELAELMQEPPQGENHGWRKAPIGTGWTSLEEPRRQHFKQFQQPWSEDFEIKHGTAAGYQGRNCRCDTCKNWWAAYIRDRRRRGTYKS